MAEMSTRNVNCSGGGVRGRLKGHAASQLTCVYGAYRKRYERTDKISRETFCACFHEQS